MNKSFTIDENDRGVKLMKYESFWAIIKPYPKPDENAAVCSVYHTGAESYIKRMWKKRYKGA